MRTGDITGDGIDDIAVGADQADIQGPNSGAVYVIRGGPHLDASLTVDLSDIGNSSLSGNIVRVLPPENADNFHFGATLNLADLDGNGTAELAVAATLNRAGASLRALNAPADSARSRGGSPGGRLFILWDDNFPATWLPDLSITVDGSAPGSITDISGASSSSFSNFHFGEEIIGGLDYNGDTRPDLFVGDITGDAFDRSGAGLGFVFFDASQLKNQNFDVANVPANIDMTLVYGPERGAISSDTALHGDFDNDGIADLALASPHANPVGRSSAGAVHILWGQSVWPTTIDLKDDLQPDDGVFPITNILGARGTRGNDTGDTLAYSAASGDINGDGAIDLIVNEMVGNGLTAGSVDAGNLIIISGASAAIGK